MFSTIGYSFYRPVQTPSSGARLYYCIIRFVMTGHTVSFAEELTRVKTSGSDSIEELGVGGVFNLRSRGTLKASSHDIKSEDFVNEKAVPQEDEDPGLKNEGDYKSKQVGKDIFQLCTRLVHSSACDG